MKIFAFFLPQFHTIPENDEWWGKGFTEWRNVKRGKKFYKDQDQPKIPLNNNYYNLLNKETMLWHAQLLRDYKLDGFIYYHYYFNGKHLLEKPAENLLRWEDVNQPFFFCWANHSWKRTWEGSQKILMKMEYGLEKDWEEHFQYLLPFFKDRRYEKKDNKPLFMLFNSFFDEKVEMINYFDKRCKEEGFNGIYLIESCSSYNDYIKMRDLKTALKPEYKLFLREPSISVDLTLHKLKYIPMRLIYKIQEKADKVFGTNFRKPKKYKGDDVYRTMLDLKVSNNSIRGLYFEWDNTPRHKNRGFIITPPSEIMVSKYLKSLKNEEYVFVNAMNEWAEGMILEPTTSNRYKYLEYIKKYKNLY